MRTFRRHARMVLPVVNDAGLPLILRELGFDPATSSVLFAATLVDVTGLIIYFSVACALLHGTLLLRVPVAYPTPPP